MHLRTQKKLILASASSGGPALALALAETAVLPLRCRVKAWINIGGLLRGTPLADRYLRWPRSWVAGLAAWYYGWEADAVASMGTERHMRLRSEGPNDGLTLITDALVPERPTLIALGQDHFLAQDPEIRPKTLALARTLMILLAERTATKPCAVT